MKIDLSKEKGALVPLYFFRKPLGWPAEERPAAPDRRQTADADRRQTGGIPPGTEHRCAKRLEEDEK